MSTPVTAPLQVEVLADPPDPDYETDWLPGPNGMRAEISGLPDGTLVHCVRLWDSSPQPVLIYEIPVRRILLQGDRLHLGCWPVN